MRWMFYGLAVLWFPIVSIAQTQEVKGAVAVVNFRKAVAQHPRAGKLESELRALSERANRDLEAKDNQLVDIEKQIRQVTNEGRTGEGKMKVESAQKLMELQQKSLETQESAVQVRAGVTSAIARRRAEELPKIAAEILEYVRAANDGKYALVLDNSSLTPEGFPQVLDYPGAVDLTDKVIALLPKAPGKPDDSKESKKSKK